MKEAEKFIEKHRIGAKDVNIQKVIDDFTSEMVNGLNGSKSSLRMIPTYIEADNQFLTEVPVVAIDAGGTNFRAAIIRFNALGKLEISDIVRAGMPGLDGEISKDEFFESIAALVKHLAEKCDRIGFCFSYPTEILPDKDGILLQFCKEVQAPGVVGQLIGKNLLETMGMKGKRIVLLNDTVATLLAGKSSSYGKNYDSFIGYILGTGSNACYIENNRNICKKPELDKNKSQIINMESGNYGIVTQTDIDKEFDVTTVNPGDYKFEKMISGGYFGGLCLTALKTGASEGLFSSESADGIMSLKELTSADINCFLSKRAEDPGPLKNFIKSKEDEESACLIINSLIERAAKLVAANLIAVILKTGKGISSDSPVLITVEGTMYYKMPNMKESIDKFLREYLSHNNQRYFEFMEVKHSSLVGAALAALID